LVTVTEETVGNYSIFDVVMPIIGHKVPLPANPDLKAIMEGIMAEDNITLEKFKSHA